ncbi:YicC/YloC family endoribonuclease [Kordiimonas pumila]|uniref:YicC/YloC family endoribonuclease n=1 Tax=Kordiimonas pumila TaxID=2161677 RepID=A0ABV7D1D2_9PROT|nr:YicC/YloC family endoribonuclease [Kordiimonas pumila]
MPLNSMTGFSRSSGAGEGYRWNWELKTVNNKGLDIRARIPNFLDGFDITIKKQLSSALTRGSVFVSLSVESEEGDESFVINEGRLQSLLLLAEKYADSKGLDKARLDGLLAIKGVVDLVGRDLTDDTRSSLEKALSKDLKLAISDLLANRADEGERMEAVLRSQLDEIASLAQAARQLTGDRLETMYARFKTQLNKLTQADTSITEERLAQELAIIAVKADIQEELDRLDSHILETEKLISSGNPVGRRLDFLCQEFNREANTLCSKSGDTNLTKIGIELKTVIDQFREQVQNIE